MVGGAVQYSVQVVSMSDLIVITDSAKGREFELESLLDRWVVLRRAPGDLTARG